MIHVRSKIFTFWENFKWVWLGLVHMVEWSNGRCCQHLSKWLNLHENVSSQKLKLNLKYICIIHLQLDYKVMCNTLSDQMILYCDNVWTCTQRYVHSKTMYLVWPLFICNNQSKCLSTCNVKSLIQLYTYALAHHCTGILDTVYPIRPSHNNHTPYTSGRLSAGNCDYTLTASCSLRSSSYWTQCEWNSAYDQLSMNQTLPKKTIKNQKLIK